MHSVSPGLIVNSMNTALHRGQSIINKLIYYYNLLERSCVPIVANFNACCEIAQCASRCTRTVVSKTPLTEHVVVRYAYKLRIADKFNLRGAERSNLSSGCSTKNSSDGKT